MHCSTDPLYLKMQMLIKISKPILIHPLFWKILGFVSSIAAFTCFALSSSFHDLFGRRNQLKIAIYSVASLILTTLMLLIKKCKRFTRSVMVKAHVGFLVMMGTSLCSIWQDLVSQKENQEMGSHERTLNMCSFGAFGLMSLSLSRQLQLGFEVGIFNFLFGSFLVMLMKMNFKLAPLAAILCYVILHIRSFSDFFMEKLGRADTKLEDIENVPVAEHSLHKEYSDDLELGTYFLEDDYDNFPDDAYDVEDDPEIDSDNFPDDAYDVEDDPEIDCDNFPDDAYDVEDDPEIDSDNFPDDAYDVEDDPEIDCDNFPDDAYDVEDDPEIDCDNFPDDAYDVEDDCDYHEL